MQRAFRTSSTQRASPKRARPAQAPCGSPLPIRLRFREPTRHKTHALIVSPSGRSLLAAD